MTERSGPQVVMVKKRLKNGEPCQKCAQAEDMLRRRELWDTIDEVVVADENDPLSPGMVLADRYHVKLAPFFVVTEHGESRVFDSPIKVAKEVLGPKKVASRAAPAHDEGGGSRQQDALPSQDLVRVGRTELHAAGPEQVLSWALSRWGSGCTIAFSGAEDVVLIDMASRLGHEFSVFTLDTGRLHPETYRFVDAVRQYYGVSIRVVCPEARAVEQLVRRKGLFSFYEDGHDECCGVRKIGPLRRILGDYTGWITGQRRDQSPTRAEVPLLDWDRAHRPEGMLKLNPLANWSLSDVWKYIRDHGVPYNELHDRGFSSVGCEPCTRALRPGEHERAARWWWEDTTKRECGLHVSSE